MTKIVYNNSGDFMGDKNNENKIIFALLSAVIIIALMIIFIIMIN